MAKSKGPGGGSKGGSELHCGLRIIMLCLLPVGASLVGYSPGSLVVFLSFAMAVVEVILFQMRTQTKSGKRRNSIRPAQFFPLQLLALYMVQLWLIMFNATEDAGGSPAGAPGLRGQADQPSANDLSQAAPAMQAAQTAPGGFDLNAPLETLRWEPKSISVVLPCAEEREYALKTVESVYQNTPQELLHEIIVVDDGSNPPLSTTHLGPENQRKYKVVIKRHEETIGLIGAKKTGGDAATGDIVVFFDCHVAPQPGWHKDFTNLISENYRRMVVPHITALDVNTWTQIGRGGGLAKCYLTWDADFKWVDSSDRYIPVISGGLLGMSRRWWQETGGYDEQMMGWGGENLDQSLRVWLCGGEIVMAPNAEVAHMWRDGSAKTAAHYKHVGDTQRNRARAIYAWYGEFAEKLQHYPSFARRHAAPDGTPWYGDLSSFQEVRDRLAGCRPFAWFLKRFKDIYEDGGIVPDEVFMLQEEKSGKCLHYQGYAGTSGTGSEGADLRDCNEHDDRLFWHPGNMDRKTGKCCSGLRAWNTDQCLKGGQGGGKAITTICTVAGLDSSQDWGLHENGQLSRGSSCLGPGEQSGTLEDGFCLGFRNKGGARWKKLAAKVPLETELYRKALREHQEYFVGRGMS